MLRIGIIGTGAIADAHIRGYQEFPEQCRIVALADVAPGRAAAKAAAFDLTDAAGYDDPADLIGSGEVDLVSIATPPSTHAPLSIAALDAGLHVLVEKPMAPSLEDCDAMLEAQRRSGTVLSVVAQNRFRDDMTLLKDVLDSGLLGSVSHVDIDSAWWRGLPYYDLWWRGTWESEGGGSTLNHAIHHIDLMLWLLGRPSEAIAMLANAQHDNADVEDLSVAVLRYGRGLARLTSSVVHHGEEQAIVIQGEHARISQPWRVTAERSTPEGFPAAEGDTALVARIEALAADRTRLRHEGHAGQIADVLGAIAEGRDPVSRGEDGRNALEVVTAIYEAGIERRAVSLPLTPDDPYYRSGHLVRSAPRFAAVDPDADAAGPHTTPEPLTTGRSTR